MAKSNIISDEDILSIRNKLQRDVQFDENYPQLLILRDIALPEGCSKQFTSLMFAKDGKNWRAYLDADITNGPDNLISLFSPYAENGWCELLFQEQQFHSAIDLLEYLTSNLLPDLEKRQIKSEDNTLCVIRNIIVYESNRTINLLYEYAGPAAIVAQEIYSLDNQLIKNLGISEVEEGWIANSWDGKDNNNTEVASGFYLLKLRSSQPLGEVFKIEFIHKNF